jgi:ribosomal protein S8
MVFYYSIRGGKCRNAHSHITLTSDDITCYVGRDKHENEYLIRYGWPGDVWFHVEGISSAHVYFRLDCFASSSSNNNNNNNVNPHVRNLLGKIPIDDLPIESIEDMCQIVKHNSIKGCKMASCRIVYTPHSNLKKEFSMDSGTVTYHDTKLQRFKRCDKDRKRIKELEATKSTDLSIDFYEEMKANERRIIDHKRKLKKSGNSAGVGSMELYDPVLNDLRGIKTKASRQGDQMSGIDSGLAALEELVLGSTSAIPTTINTNTNTNTNTTTTSSFATANANANANTNKTKNATTANSEDRSDLPIWQREANDRLEMRTTERVRFLMARGYTLQEIQAATSSSLPKTMDESSSSSSSVPFSVTLFELWNTNSNNNNNNNVEPLPAEIYEARTEEREVLEAIYGQDDHVQFGWRNDTAEGEGEAEDGEADDDSEEEDDDEPSRPFSFDSIIPVPGYEPPSRYEYPPPLLLEIYVDHGVSHYPFGRSDSDDGVEPPLLAVVGGGLPFEQLRKLNQKLKEAAVERAEASEPGEPQIFDLLQAAGELAEAVVEEESAAIAEEAKKQRAQRAKEERAAAKEEAERMGIVGSTSTKLTFRSEADRRAYAQSVVKSL